MQHQQCYKWIGPSFYCLIHFYKRAKLRALSWSTGLPTSNLKDWILLRNLFLLQHLVLPPGAPCCELTMINAWQTEHLRCIRKRGESWVNMTKPINSTSNRKLKTLNINYMRVRSVIRSRKEISAAWKPDKTKGNERHSKIREFNPCP